MAVILFLVAAALAALLVYLAWGRAWLKAQPWAAGFFAWVEPVEILLYQKSETILFARLKVLVGLALTLLSQAGTIDFSPMLPLIPEQHRGWVQVAINCLPMVITVMGLMDERLRRTTTMPLALVAVPETKPVPPVVAEAIEQANEAKQIAVAVVKTEQPNA